MWSITALDLDTWSNRTSTRSTLPGLVRRLINNTASPARIDFPAYEGVDAPGWDGKLQLDDSTSAWTPKGPSFWEASCRKDVVAKANFELAKRTDLTPEDVRRASTFVFVTARRWPGGDAWAKAAREAGDWADVRAYDAETLEQWLEKAPAAAVWMHSQLGRGVDDLCSLDDLWDTWAGATVPRLPFEIFAEAYEENRSALQEFFAAPPTRVLPVAADTRGEAAAFATAALMFGAGEIASSPCIVVRTEAGLHRLRRESRLPIMLIADRRLEAELGDLPQKTWVLVATDRASLDGQTPVGVKPLTWEAFHRTVRALDLDGAAAAELDEASGRRATIIRRRLSSIPEVRRPLWAAMPDLTPTLAALALAGGWYWERAGDRKILSELAGQDEAAVEATILRAAILEDAPIFSVAGAGGIISRHDAFPPLRTVLTRSLIERFFAICRLVFLEPDPAHELAVEDLWLANIYGKDRPHSGRLRWQMATSMAFLSTAKTSYLDRFDARQASECLVADLLTDDSAWFHLRDVLPDLAEAAPRAFLEAATRCLPFEADDRGIWSLVKPTPGNGVGESLRLKLIWALERLGADPAYFSRVAEIFAALATRPLDDNLITKPHASLVAMLHPGKAQDANTARLQGRVLSALAARRPDVGWTVALALLDNRFGGGLALQSAQPIGAAGDEVGDGPANSQEVAFEIALGRSLDSAEALALIEKSPCFDGERLGRLWDRIAEWQETAGQPDRAKAREGVRRSALWRERRQDEKLKIGVDGRAREVFHLLRAPGPAGQYAWLFQSGYVEQGSDELWDEKLNWEERKVRIEASRKGAVEALWSAGRLATLVEFAKGVGSPETVGSTARLHLVDLNIVEVAEFLDMGNAWPGARDFITGVLAAPVPTRCEQLAVLRTAWAERLPAFLEILLLSPPDAATWDQVDQLPADLRMTYWRRLTRRTWSDAPQDIARACAELLRVERPRAALNQISNSLEGLATSLLTETLVAVSQVAGPEEDGLIDPGTVEEILSVLDHRPDADRNQLLQFDFIYVEALEHSIRGIAALSEEIAVNPELFAQAIRGYYRRDDGTEEIVEERDRVVQQRAALHWMRVLETCRRAPGSNAEGVVEAAALETWLRGLAPLLSADGRSDRGFYRVGQLLGRLRLEADGVWPPLDVAAVLEPYADESFRRGLEIGILNSRGVHSREFMAGGAQERAIADKFRGWRRRVEVEYPRLAEAFENVAASYDSHARREDDESEFQRLAVR